MSNLSWLNDSALEDYFNENGHFGVISSEDSYGQTPAKCCEVSSSELGKDVLPDVDLNTLPISQGVHEWYETENQGAVGQCSGEMRAGIGEISHYRITEGEVVQFSAPFAYRTNQLMDQKLYGWRDRGDTGASIPGSMEAGKLYGNCRKELMPSNGRYQTSVPKECYTDAEQNKFEYTVQLENYMDMLKWLVYGYSGCGAGLGFNATMTPDSRTGRIEGYQFTQIDHAMLFGDWNMEYRDENGWPWLTLFNSHGKKWGINGRGYVSPRLANEMCRRGQIFAGTNTNPFDLKPLSLDWRKVKILG